MVPIDKKLEDYFRVNIYYLVDAIVSLSCGTLNDSTLKYRNGRTPSSQRLTMLAFSSQTTASGSKSWPLCRSQLHKMNEQYALDLANSCVYIYIFYCICFIPLPYQSNMTCASVLL